jgi:hypothetical protein
MYTDPILDELHAIRDQIAKECNYDVGKILEYSSQHAERLGFTTVSFPPKRLPVAASTPVAPSASSPCPSPSPSHS